MTPKINPRQPISHRRLYDQSRALLQTSNLKVILIWETIKARAKVANKKIMSPAGGLGHKQAGGFAIVACLFVPHI